SNSSASSKSGVCPLVSGIGGVSHCTRFIITYLFLERPQYTPKSIRRGPQTACRRVYVCCRMLYEIHRVARHCLRAVSPLSDHCTTSLSAAALETGGF